MRVAGQLPQRLQARHVAAEAQVQDRDRQPGPSPGHPSEHVGAAAPHSLAAGGGVTERRGGHPGPGHARDASQAAGARWVGHHLQAPAVAPLDLEAAAPQARCDPLDLARGGR